MPETAPGPLRPLDLKRVLAGEVDAVARRLLGLILRSEVDGEAAEVVLTEVEAYGGDGDPASHAHRGPTARNRAMFDAPGTIYVYRSYGIHWCMNIVARPAGQGGAVLLRAGRPRLGADVMARRRGRSDHLADGPGKLCQALGIDGRHDATRLNAGPVHLLAGPGPEGVVLATPRVGISRETERPWRFVVAR